MASFSFNVRVSWKGDSAKGADMERIVHEAFTAEEPADEKAKTLGELLNKRLFGGPEEIRHFGKALFPRTMELYWEETRADPEHALPVIFETFPDLQFRLQIVNDDAEEYQCRVFQKGKQKSEVLEEFDDWEKYDKDLYKWLAADIEEVFLFSKAMKYIPAKNWKDEAFCKNAVAHNGCALEFVDDKLKTLALCKAAINQTIAAASFLPEKFRKQFFSDKDFCKKAVEEGGRNAYKFVPNEYRDAEISRIAVGKFGERLGDVPKELITAELCALAITHTEQNMKMTFRAVPENLRTAKLCLLVMEKASDNNMYSSKGESYWDSVFSSFPDSCKTPELGIMAIAKARPGDDTVSFLEGMPENAVTPELCRAACEKYGYALQAVPEKQRSAELCRTAILSKAGAIKYVPEELLPKLFNTQEFSMAAIARAGYNEIEDILKQIPDKFKTSGLWLAAVGVKGILLKQVPASMKTNEMCEAAMKQSAALAIEHVPDNLKTPEMCLAAVNDSKGRALKYVPDILKTKEICLAAFAKMSFLLDDIGIDLEKTELDEIWRAVAMKKREMLEYMPLPLKTAELCQAVIDASEYGKDDVLKFTPDAVKTAKMCQTAFEDNANAFQYIPDTFKTAEMCRTAVEKGYRNLEFVPDTFKTAEMCRASVEQLGRTLAFVPEKFKTKELCIAALKNEYLAMEYVPQALLTPEFILTEIQKNPHALQYVPDSLKTAEICIAAVKENEWVIEYVPEALQAKVRKEAGIEDED